MSRKISYSAAINEALIQMMEEDPKVFVLGEDVAKMGGDFGITRGIWQRWPDRIKDTSLSESAIIGLSCGAAICGLKPVPEIMFGDFLGVCFDQLVNNAAKMNYMTEVPRKIVIVGGGVIGIEFVGIYNAFGADVTVVEFLPKILPPIDEEIAARSQMILENKGVKFMTGTKLESIEKSDAGLVVKADNGKEVVSIECDQVLVATGRAIDVEGMGLDKIGVTYDRKGIKVDENFETNVKGIYAIGDVIGNMMLAHD